MRNTPFNKEQVFEVITNHTIDFGYMPSIRKIHSLCEMKNIATTAKYFHMLEDEGYVFFTHNRYCVKGISAFKEDIDTTALDEKEKETFDVLICFILSNNCIPTERELTGYLPYHPSQIHRYMVRLQEKGFVKVYGHQIRVAGIGWKLENAG